MNERRIIVKTPASTANLGPGFDTLGMALSLYTWIDMAATDGPTRIELLGGRLKGIPTDKSNLIYKMAQLVYDEAGYTLPELEIAMYSEIPLTRGLGSSATAIVGALTAANVLAGRPLSDQRLLELATAEEGHPDNVGASLLGGIVVAAAGAAGSVDCIRLEPHARLEVLVAIPDFQLATEKARHALPDSLPLADAVHNVGRSSLLTAALAIGRLDLIGKAMQDRIHQPFRAPLIPGMADILARAAAHGALGAALSGAGPTLLTLVDAHSTRKQELERFLLDTLESAGVRAELRWLQPVRLGPEVELLDRSMQDVPLMDWIKGEVKHD
ncbi:homoserine kinase [Paenibacillus sp. IB182496]|uniref:Homoserine kinase n=1 Tax=Paenibacillus sabuli TaxID=2772509 RepID=A0A927BSG2_9BACL|nr:homoserine kinase [Paenibacillus sabuli]MBD2844598.1 homoserine kinase [Paenibacillus sabuli]